ncbi:MAG: ribonuclease HIII [Planctomycetaceae bacterium]
MSVTLDLPRARIDALRASLEEEGFELRALDHGHFQARGEGVVVSAYRSGKVVVQGKGEALFLERRGLGPAPARGLAGLTVGSDESGKGDYFGPLVVAAVAVTPGREEELARLGVRDSKRMGDSAVLQAAVAVRALFPHAIRALSPEEYNERHEREGNVALFLSTMHAEAIAEAARAAKGCDRVVIDQFTFSARLEAALRAVGVVAPVEIRPRAEDNPAVAAASVLARAEFLIGLRELGSEQGVELPKGAGGIVERAARRIFQEGGLPALSALAKMHFKTTHKVTGLF